MDIHKPKPWHGVREFLKEYVIIVIGVLTALGAEQGVEWLHWRHQLEFTEGALQREVRGNLIWAALRTRQSACGEARLAHLSVALRQRGPAWTGDPVATLTDQATPVVYQMPVYRWGAGAWQTAQASGVLNHMAPDRLASYAAIFNLIEGTRDRQVAETAMSPKLGALAFDLTLDAAQRTGFMTLVSELDALNGQMARRATILDQATAGMGIRLSSKDRETVAQMKQGTLGGCLYHGPPPDPS